MQELERRVDGLETRIEQHERILSRLNADMAEIRGFLGHVATKADLSDMGTKIERAINGLLRDALNAVPLKHSAMWGGVAAIAAIGALFVSIVLSH